MRGAGARSPPRGFDGGGPLSLDLPQSMYRMEEDNIGFWSNNTTRQGELKNAFNSIVCDSHAAQDAQPFVDLMNSNSLLSIIFTVHCTLLEPFQVACVQVYHPFYFTYIVCSFYLLAYFRLYWE